MLDATLHAEPHQRARGGASVALSVRGGRVRLDRLRQAGCAKAFLPVTGGPLEVVFLNTAGGLTGGDRLRYEVDIGAGAAATATTQTAERVYASTARSVPAELEVAATVGAGGHLDWLPQETILFDKARVERRTRIALARDASLLMCEALVLGRAAMGETVVSLDLFDRREVLRDGMPVLVDSVGLDGQTLAQRGAAAGLSDARAVASVALVARGAEDAAAALRGIALPPEVQAGIGGWDGKCVVRLMAPDGWPLRVALAALLRHLRSTRELSGALPRVWQI